MASPTSTDPELRIAELEARCRDLEERLSALQNQSDDESPPLLSRDSVSAKDSLFTMLFESIPLGLTHWDNKGRLIRANKGFTDLTGYDDRDIATLEDWFPLAYPDPQYRAQVLAEWSSDKEQPGKVVREFAVSCKNGQVKHVEFRAAFFHDETALVTMSDVTEQHENQIALQESEERYRALSRATNEAIFISDKGICVDANEAASAMFGYAHEELLGIFGTDVIAPESVETVKENMLQGYEHPYEAFGLRKDGSTFPATFHGKMFHYKGSLIRATAVRDLSDHKEAEQRLLEREQRLSVIFQNSPLGMIFFDQQGTIVDCNNRFVLIMGSSREKLIGFNTASQSDNPKMRQAVKKALSGKSAVFEDEYTSVTGGRTTYIRVVFNPVHPGQDPTDVIATLEDVTERHQSEKMLRESEQRYRQLFEHTSAGIFLHDLIFDGQGRAVDYVITDVNPAGLGIVGINKEDIVNKPATEAYGVDKAPYIDIFSRTAATGRPEHFETYFPPMRKHFQVLAYSYRTGSFATVFSDVTEQKKMEETMVQTEKMLSVGGLAAGMAHEINNPLAGILGSIQVVQQRLLKETDKNRKLAEECGLAPASLALYAKRQEIPSLLESVREAGTRASTIVNDMLSFSRKGSDHMVPCDLCMLLDRAVELASRDYDLKRRFDFKAITITRQYEEDLPAVTCEANQVQQVFLNILSNGAQAMAEKSYGLEASPGLILSVAKAGYTVRVSIEDNGAGMNEEVRKRVFEPFFTTKEVGTGTGLGLSVSYFIITRNHSGAISCESKPGQGSTFTIHLPINPPEEPKP